MTDGNNLEQDVAGPLVSVVIVAFNNADTIEACLDSLRVQLTCPHETIVVDNSTDGSTRARLYTFRAKWPQYPLHCIIPQRNLGFAAGCNRGAADAKGRRLLFLNPDTVLENNIVATFEAHLKLYPETGITGPKILNGMGEVERTCRNLPNLGRILLDATGLDRKLGAYRLLRFDHLASRQVPQLIGACLYTPTDLFNKLGGFDERFFVYFEEVDLCKRAMEAGFENWFVPDAVITHLAGTSCESESSTARMIFQLRKSRMLYFRKHFQLPSVFAMAVINMLEGSCKGAVFTALALFRTNSKDQEKANGFWRVALCFGCWH